MTGERDINCGALQGSGLHETAQAAHLQSQTWGLGRHLGASKDWDEP